MLLRQTAYKIILTIILLLTLSCSKNENSGTGPNETPPKALNVNPAQGTPGAVLNISAYTFIQDSVEEYSVYLGDEPASFRITGDSSFTIAIPYFIDTTTNWSEPPTEGAYLEIWKDDELLARSNTKITVLPLAKATGTTKQIQEILDTLVTDLQLLFASLPTPNSWEQEYRDSLMTVLRSIISGPDLSLAALLDGSSSILGGKEVDPELADAIMASSGMLEYWQSYAEFFATSSGKLRAKISSMQSPDFLCYGDGDDEDLACQMQLYVLIRDFAETFLHQTRVDWEHDIGWLFDAVSMYPPAKVFPPVVLGKVIGAVLQITDIMINNAVLSLLPSRIVSFGMVLESTTMETDEFTKSQFLLIAGNTPRDMTIGDVITAVFAFADLQYPTYSTEVRSVVTDIIQAIVGQLQNIYAYMYTLAPDVFAHPSLTNGDWLAYPDMMWPVEILSHDLIELRSSEPEILEPNPDVHEWWSANCGEATIEAHTVTGAFGEESASTPSHHVTIGHPGGMNIVITGLPEADSADVWVYFPDNAFKYVGSSISLTELESGAYRIDANDVEGSDGIIYASDPQTQTVDVTCDSTTVVEINYVQKFGSIYVVLVGLDDEISRDSIYVRIEGPGDILHEINRTKIIDSLEPGIYDVFALEVDDGWGQTWVPDPSYSELTVKRSNVSTLTITYKEKFGSINIQTPHLPSGLEADIDVTGPNDYFHHSIDQEELDSLLPGEYTAQAYPIVDAYGDTITPSPLTHVVTVEGGESVMARFDYSGGHELTIGVTGLPELADADISIVGPEGYSTTVTGDTVLKVPVGSGYIVTANDVIYEMRKYTAKPADTTVNMTYKRTVSFKYKTRSIMSLFLGDARGTDEEDPKAQLLVSAFSSSTNEDTTITDDKYAPDRGTFPEQISLDSCDFESGRQRLDGTYFYQVYSSTSRGTASADITIEIQDTSAVVTFNGRITTSPSAISTNSGSVRAKIDLSKLFRIEIYNPNEAGESPAYIYAAGRFEFMNKSNLTHQNIVWTNYKHPCNDDWIIPNRAVLAEYINAADTLQVWQNWFSDGGLGASGGGRVEATEDLIINLNSSTIHPGDPVAVATVYGRIVFTIKNLGP